jgi:hypothetical protein
MPRVMAWWSIARGIRENGILDRAVKYGELSMAKGLR